MSARSPSADGPPTLDPEVEMVVAWAMDRIKRHLVRYGARLELGAGRVGDIHVSVEEVGRILGGDGRWGLVERAGITPDDVPVPCPGVAPGPSACVAHRFGLAAHERALLLAAAAPQLSADIARLYTFAWADFTRKQPSVAFLCELVSDGPVEAMALHAAFRGDRPLVAHHLVHLVASGDAGPEAPDIHRGVVIAPSVLGFLRGDPPVVSPPVLHAMRRAEPDVGSGRGESLGEAELERLRRVVRVGDAKVLLVGARGTGRLTTISALMRAQGRSPLVFAIDSLPAEPATFASALLEIGREGRLRDRPLVLRCDEIALEEGDMRATALRRLLHDHPGTIAVLTRREPSALPRDRVFHVVRFPMPDARAQGDLWREALSRSGVRDPELAVALAERFSVSPGTIAHAIAEGLEDAAMLDQTLGAEHISRAIRRRIRHDLHRVAEPIRTGLRWQDAVLPPEVAQTLEEIRAQARNRSRVFDTWGFRRTVGHSRGLGCLFSGPPGTGKTMMAGILAADLGRELYRVDLSRVVSKWVGETEKNLARVFDEAERAQVILLFDEADSLFAARTEVKGANDRFANMEVNYLLQRMESFDGMTILTTNFERSLDEAFKRRLRFRVHFPLPNLAERAQLWRRLIPVSTPVEWPIDFERLARRHKLSGGNIKNAVLRAAFYAAEAGSALTGELLHRAALAESREMGRL